MQNQGRSKGFILPKVLAANPDLLVILSTKNVHLDVLKDLQKYKFQVLNANEGVIMIDFYDTFFKATQNKASNQHWWLRKF